MPNRRAFEHVSPAKESNGFNSLKPWNTVGLPEERSAGWLPGCLVAGAALLSMFGGVFLAAVSIFGFGIADMGLIPPDREGGFASVFALPLVGLPLWYFYRRVARQRELSLIQIIGILVILGIMFLVAINNNQSSLTPYSFGTRSDGRANPLGGLTSD